MKKSMLLYAVLLCLSWSAVSQNETANWYFGNGAGLSFSNGIRSVLYDGAMTAPAGCTSISDRDGNLRFYSNGKTIWNSNHQVMDNGDNLAGEIELTQTSIIVPNPANDDSYYIFTLRKENGDSFIKGIYYSVVEFSAAQPLGVVTQKNVFINNASGERITAIYLPEENQYKVITFTKAAYPHEFGTFPPENPENDTFSFINVTTSGVALTSTFAVENATISTVGTMKISPNGQRLAIADNGQSRIFIYDIDPVAETVEYDFYIFTGLFGMPDVPPYSLEFSPDSQILYYSALGMVFQFYDNDYIAEKFYLGSGNGALQLAMDGKIYIAKYDDEGGGASNYLSVINKPNEVGANCGFESLAIDLSPKGSFKGLPNFVQSYFENRILTENRCVFDTFAFDINAYGPVTSVLWEFGDGNVSTEAAPQHQFQLPGEYVVKATIDVYGIAIDLYKQIIVFPLPSAEEDVVITQCDIDADGVSFFNLYNFTDYVDHSDTTAFELSFFDTYEQALNDTSPIANPEAYENTSNPEQIFVRIQSPEGCVSISDFQLQSTYMPLDGIQSLYACEGSDLVFGNSTGQFDLRPKRNEIRTLFGLSASATITFYASLQDAQTMTNPLDDQYDTGTATIWVRVVEADGGCGGVGPIQLFVGSNLEIGLEDNYMMCHPSLQPPLTLDGGVTSDGWEWRDPNGNIVSTQRFFNPTAPGSYSLTVYKTDNGLECSRSKNFTVGLFGAPSFEVLVADNYQIQIVIDGSSSYEYSLDGIHYAGQGTTHTFTGIAAGVHTVYVRDQNDCEPPISQEVSFVGFPKFFTPNNDNYNDTWKIEGLSNDLYLFADVKIYDRYGKFLFAMDLDSNNYGWDGTFKKQMLTPTDYWFVAKLIDVQNNVINKSGHFALRL